MKLWSKIDVDLARRQGSGSNRLEPLQSSAKQCFAVVWSHLDTFRVVFYHFLHTFRGFFEVLGAGAGRAPEPAQSENLEDFG